MSKRSTSSNQIRVKPVPIDKWHGKKGEQSFSMPVTIEAEPDRRTSQYKVDLTKREWERIKKELNLDDDDLTLVFDPERPHDFFGTKKARIKLENKTNLFYKNNPMHILKLGILRGSSSVANSLEEWEEGDFPLATHYIEDKERELEAKASVVEMERKAVIKSDKLTKQDKINLLKCLSSSGRLEEYTEKYLTLLIDKEIKKDAENFLYWISKDKKDVAMQALVHEAIDMNIFQEDGHKIKYYDSLLGDSIDSVADYLKEDENQEFMLMIKQKLKE